MKTVAFLFFASFSAVSYGVTEAGTHSLEPDTYYHISFSFYGTTNTQGRIVNFNMPGFLLNSHSLSGAETCRFDRVIRTWRKPDKENVRAYFNTYGVTGPVAFEGLKITKVDPKHKKKGGLELGAGERIGSGHYRFKTDFSSSMSMAFRPFYSACNGRFHDLQWRMQAKGEIVFRHELSGRSFMSATVGTGVSRTTSPWALEWSHDTKNWHEFAHYKKGASAKVEIPAKAFPCEVIYVRIVGRGNKGFDCSSYSLDARVDGNPKVELFGDTVWVDAASGKEVLSGRTPQIAAKGALLKCDDPKGTRFWTCDSGWKVLREQDVPASNVQGLSLQMAANEAEAVQLVIRPNREIQEPVIEASDLLTSDGRRIPASSVEVLRVGYVFVDTPSDSTSSPGWWPDPIMGLGVACKPLCANENQPFWIRVKVPKGTTKGIYRGTLSVSGVCKNLVKVPLEVEVFGFKLPEVMTCKTAFGFNPGTMRKMLRLNRPQDTNLFHSTVDRYVKCLSDHHLSVYDPQPWKKVKCKWTNPEDPLKAEPVFDWSEFDAKTERAFSYLHQNTVKIPHGGVLGGGTYEKRYFGKILKWKDGDPEYEGLLKKYLSAIDRHFVEKGWTDKSYVYWFDEPKEKDYAFVSNGMARLKKYAPNLKRMITAGYASPLLDNVNLWCPTTSAFNGKGKDFVRSRGDEMWWYVCCVPKSPYATEFIDKVGTEMRVWLWQTWGERVSGILIWQTIYWAKGNHSVPQNPYLDPQCWYGSDGSLTWGNGDGRFLYPPPRCFDSEGKWIKKGPPICDAPVETYRLEMLRDGIEDYEYFAILSSLDPKNPLLKIPKSVYSSLISFTTDPEPIKIHRRKLAEAIESIKKRKNSGKKVKVQ